MAATLAVPFALAPSLLTVAAPALALPRPDTRGSHWEVREAGTSFRRLSAVSRPESEALRTICVRVKLAR